MNILEQKNFIKSIVPFNRVNDFTLDEVCKALDIVYFKEDTLIYQQNKKPQFLYFIIKGVIQELGEDEILSVYVENEYFDPITLIENNIKHNFVAKHESICYALPREIFLHIMYQNEELEGFFFQSISDKLNDNLKNEQNKGLVNFMMAKVSDAYLQKPIIIDENETIYNAALTLKNKKGSSLIIKGSDQYGIVTDTDFREKVILNRINFNAPIKNITTFGLKTISDEEFLFNAQLQMNKFEIKRLIVLDKKEEIIGVLDLIALTSFFASHTYSIILELDNTHTIDELKSASEKFIRVVRVLYAKGVKVRYISKIVSQLNTKLFRKLYEMLCPIELQEKSCLVIMGSEGREEQVLRTDQDNALIIADDCDIDIELIEEFSKSFTQHLIDFGYPKCSGNIMVSNQYWRKTKKEFEHTIFEWINTPNEENHMNLAIFYDAFGVAGDKYLLVDLKEYLFKMATDSTIFHSFFAKPVLNFETPLSMFANFVVDKNKHKNELDIKKGGIFAIVHGVRALSLEHKIKKTNTVERIKELEILNVIDTKFASELIESFTVLLTLRLKFR
ncbi:MAG TPA: cyclic nucleotide-binding domain-containing protein, partial [Arcobacter sp.]|nr:cyclic nucleotide-binding domain-containing protein [Arcobacter sp.]